MCPCVSPDRGRIGCLEPNRLKALCPETISGLESKDTSGREGLNDAGLSSSGPVLVLLKGRLLCGFTALQGGMTCCIHLSLDRTREKTERMEFTRTNLLPSWYMRFCLSQTSGNKIQGVCLNTNCLFLFDLFFLFLLSMFFFYYQLSPIYLGMKLDFEKQRREAM